MAGTRWASRLTVFQNAVGTAPNEGGTITFYETGTSDLEAVYLDSALADESENPIELDADGRLPNDIFLDDSVLYRIVMKTAGGATIAEDDPAAGNDVVSGIEAHDVSLTAHYNATTTNRGFVSELANDAEAIAKADTSRVLTPSNLAALSASDTFAGFSERATNAEAEAGIDAVRFMTPASTQTLQATAAEILTGTDTLHFMGPAAFAASASAAQNGYYKMPGGITFQWGRFSAGGDTTTAATFPVAFTTACYSCVIGGGRSSGDEDDNPPSIVVSTITTTGFDAYNDGSGVDCTFFAVGK